MRDDTILNPLSSILSSKEYGFRVLARGVQEVRRDSQSLSKERSGDAAGALPRAAGIRASGTRSDRVRRATHGPVTGAGMQCGEFLYYAQHETHRATPYSSLPHVVLCAARRGAVDGLSQEDARNRSRTDDGGRKVHTV